jgi:GTP-binding protein
LNTSIRVREAHFVASAVGFDQYPEINAPEIAFVGRSNVGKSSMINTLVGRRKLVRVSKTPGRTRTINFFLAELERDHERRQFGLVDLPGYGFARVPKQEHAGWDEMIVAYLKRRAALRMIIQIVDAEIGATELDEQTLRYLAQLGRAVRVVATKADRLAKAKRKPQMFAIAKRLGLEPNSVLPFSSTDDFGVPETIEAIWSVLGRTGDSYEK